MNINIELNELKERVNEKKYKETITIQKIEETKKELMKQIEELDKQYEEVSAIYDEITKKTNEVDKQLSNCKEIRELQKEVLAKTEKLSNKIRETNEAYDKYDNLIAFLNDDLPTEETVIEETKEETTVNDSKEDIDELLNLLDLPNEEKKEKPVNQFAQDFDKPSKKEEAKEELIKYSTPIKPIVKNEMIAESDDMDFFISLAPKEEETPKEEKKEVKTEAPSNDSKWKVAVEKTTITEESSNKEEIDSLIDQWELSDSQKGVLKQS